MNPQEVRPRKVFLSKVSFHELREARKLKIGPDGLNGTKVAHGKRVEICCSGVVDTLAALIEIRDGGEIFLVLQQEKQDDE